MKEETRDHQFSLAKIGLVSKALQKGNLPNFLCDEVFQETLNSLITLVSVSSNFFMTLFSPSILF